MIENFLTGAAILFALVFVIALLATDAFRLLLTVIAFCVMLTCIGSCVRSCNDSITQK